MTTAFQRKSILGTILLAGLVAGTLDICAAFTHAYLERSTRPEVVLKYVAGGVFGLKKSMAGGTDIAIYGLLFHYLIATIFAALFAFLYLSIKAIRRNIVVWGLLYGAVVWLIMNRIVVPMSKINSKKPITFDKNMIIALLIIMFCVGLPVALVTHSRLKSRAVAKG
jgi:uncharacterized membrane protein YagU involved in acid resistance